MCPVHRCVSVGVRVKERKNARTRKSERVREASEERLKAGLSFLHE